MIRPRRVDVHGIKNPRAVTDGKIVAARLMVVIAS